MKLDPNDLKYTQRSVYRLDDECNLKIQDLADPKNMGFATIVKLVWAGLIHKNQNITIDYVLSEYDDIMENLGQYVEAIDNAAARDFPQGEPEKN